MNIRAVILDIYGTLLEVGPPCLDAQSRWERLWQTRLHTGPRLSLQQFSAECEHVIAREHAKARGQGIAHPEIHWPDVVSAVVPEFAHLSENERGDFRFYQRKMAYAVRLMPGAVDALRKFRDWCLCVGVASNCQAYTLRELDAELTGAGLSRDLFVQSLCFFSFDHGFSKPDPHVFRILTARLGALGIGPQRVLMVGDRRDHDIEPARLCGWQAWQIGSEGDGEWHALLQWLEQLQTQTST